MLSLMQTKHVWELKHQIKFLDNVFSEDKMSKIFSLKWQSNNNKNTTITRATFPWYKGTCVTILQATDPSNVAVYFVDDVKSLRLTSWQIFLFKIFETHLTWWWYMLKMSEEIFDIIFISTFFVLSHKEIPVLRHVSSPFFHSIREIFIKPQTRSRVTYVRNVFVYIPWYGICKIIYCE